MKHCRPDRRNDDGQIAVLVLGYVIIAAALIFVVTSASYVHLERKRLLAIADAAALDAADSTSRESYLAGTITPGDGVPLTDADVRTSVREYLRRTRPDLDGLRIVEPTGAVGHTAQVSLQASVRPPLWVALPGAVIGRSSVTMRVTSQAEVVLN